MCVVSNIGDNYRDNFAPRWPHVPVQPYMPTSPQPVVINTSEVSKQEFEALKKEVEELKQLLKAAKKFDEETGQPDCHMDDKVDFIKKLAEFVGVDLEDIFKK
jgi:hypothetical protein